MKKRASFPQVIVLTLGIMISFPSCGSQEDSAKAKENRSKADQLKLESDQLAAEAMMIQQKIRDHGSSETTSEKIVETLIIEEKSVQGEGGRLEKIAADLKLANESMHKEKAAFGQKYLIP